MVTFEFFAVAILAAVLPSTLFGFLFFMHARGERRTTVVMTKEAFAHINSKDSIMASEARANELYQEEAIREQAAEFNKRNKYPKVAAESVGPTTITDQNGATYEVLSGMD